MGDSLSHLDDLLGRTYPACGEREKKESELRGKERKKVF